MEGQIMPMKLTSSAFAEGQAIPVQFTGDGHDISVPLKWTDAPEETKSFALICEDPDAPRGIWTHWVLCNLPADVCELQEGVAATATLSSGAIQGKNDFGNVGYGGPAPPRGKPHRYFFKLYALDRRLDPRPVITRSQLLSAMAGHVLAECHLMGTYKR
jgi:Raf kinase inhibitor-like YbhB/YbcL family protein